MKPTLLLPDDPVEALAIKRWNEERNSPFKLKEKNGGNRKLTFPRTCPKGHLLESEADLEVVTSSVRTYRWCLECRRATRRVQAKRHRERNKIVKR